jgi:hypothetical protein
LADRSTDRPAFVKASAGRQDISLLALRAAFSKPSVLNPVASGDLIPTRGTGCGSPTPSACSSPGNQNRNQKRLTQGQSFLILLRALHAFRTAIWQIPGNISPFKIVNYW